MKPLTKILILTVLVLISGCQSYDQKENEAVLRWNKTSADIKLKIANQSFENRKYVQAKTYLDESLSQNPHQAQAYLLAGKIDIAENNNTKAADHLLKAIELDKSMPQAWFLLGFIAENNSENLKASKCYLEAHRLDKKNIKYVLSVARIYIAMGNFQQAQQFLQRNMHASGDDQSIKLAIANLNMQTGNYQTAIDYYRQAAIESGGKRDILESLGYCYIAAEQWKQATDIFEKLAQTAPVPLAKEYIHIIAACNMNSGEFSKAASQYDKVSADNRDNPHFWVKIGQAHLGTNSGLPALACAKRALKLKPGMLEALNLKTAALYLMKDYRACIETAEAIIAKDSNSSFAWMISGRSYEKLGNFEKAKEAYRQSLRIEPNNKNVLKFANKL